MENGNRRRVGEGVYIDVLDRANAPHVAVIRARIRRQSVRMYNAYCTPWATIAFATFKKPAIFAPIMKLPLWPYFSAAAAISR